MAKVIPGILTDSEEEYVKRLKMAEEVSDIVQIDVVDGKFSKNETVDVEVIKRHYSSSRLEIQLMVVEPEGYIESLGSLDYVFRIIFPLEVGAEIKELIYKIKGKGKQAGLSLNPETGITDAKNFLDEIDLLLLMTGKPGYSGQNLGDDTYERIGKVRELSSSVPLEIDIGVNEENCEKLARSGANFLVASSALYSARDFYLAYEKLAKLAGI